MKYFLLCTLSKKLHQADFSLIILFKSWCLLSSSWGEITWFCDECKLFLILRNSSSKCFLFFIYDSIFDLMRWSIFFTVWRIFFKSIPVYNCPLLFPPSSLRIQIGTGVQHQIMDQRVWGSPPAPFSFLFLYFENGFWRN